LEAHNLKIEIEG